MSEYEARLKEFFNLGKYFLMNVATIADCISEAQETQKYLGELIEIKRHFDEKMASAKNRLEVFMAKTRDTIRREFKKSGDTITEQRVEDKLIANFSHDYLTLKEDYDFNRIRFEQADKFTMMMFQRKDYIIKTIEFLTAEKEREGCIMNNRSFIGILEKILGV